jgi:chaperone required for assembly of F1-ATPase
VTGWARRRFWESARPAAADAGFAVALDDEPLNTPGEARLLLPTAALAAAIAEEWQAVEGEIQPERLPLTRLAVAAIDQVAPAPGSLVEAVAAYGGTDLLCYRAEEPEALARRQGALWDPLLDWAERTFGATLVPVEGVMHFPQPEASLAALRREVERLDAFRLAGLAELVMLSGSLVLGLAVARTVLRGEEAWPLSRVDEDWQIEQWGEDAEAAAAAARRRSEFLAAERFVRLVDA